MGITISDYGKVSIYFWPFHNKLGEPDLLLVFSGNAQPPICFILEAKLRAAKSGKANLDQLNRYLYASNDEEWLCQISGQEIPPECLGLIYLTPKASWAELRESIRYSQDRIWTENRLFALEWKDISEAATGMEDIADYPYSGILQSVVGFLSSLKISPFQGFKHVTCSNVASAYLPFHDSLPSGEFKGFALHPLKKMTTFHLLPRGD